ncbi:MAG: stalk domain-containing protein [Clostridiales bacterium]|nr:stalk domain-containing protein [Clostridiales bacterium]
MKRRILSVILVIVMALSLAAGVGAAPAGAPAYTCDEILEGKLLKPFTLAGSFKDGVINNYEVNENASVYLWDGEGESFEAAALSAEVIVGSFVQLWDVSGGGKADGILAVSWEDSKAYWDGGKHWDMEEFDDEGAFSAGQPWRIPFGQRLLEGYGVGGALEDFSNIVDYADLQGSTYWPLHDYYKATSSDTLTMLTGFRTTQQATGWACGPTSAVMVLDWFGLRGDLNEEDLAALRQKPAQGGATNLRQMINIFEGLNDLSKAGKGEWGEWEILSSYDIVEDYGFERPEGGKYNLMSAEYVMDGSLIKDMLADGIPILVGWNSFGGHWQVVIGYDDMGTEDTKDDVLILADPYDTTDHRNDGYNIQSLERLVYDWSAGFDPDFRHGIFVAACPVGWRETYEPVMGKGIADYKKGYDGDGSDGMKLSYGRTAADISKYYPDTPWRGDNGLAGAATGGYERETEVFINTSPYYAHYDYYNLKSGESAVSGGELVILEGFKTQQQTTEWTCGLTSALMALEWFGANPGQPGLLDIYSDAELATVADAYEDLDADDLRDDRLTEINLARLRGEGRGNPGATTLDDMMNIFDNLNEDTGYLKALAAANGWDTIHKWAYLTTDDLSEESEDGFILGEDGEEHYLADGLDGDGLIPYYLGLGYPILIGWDEWGGHWQVIVGYDDMGTTDTQDDVLILADPYDTTDQNQDGYYLEAFERLVYGWGARFDERGELVFIIPYLTDTEIPVGAYGSGGVKVTVDGIALTFDVAPRNLSGRIVVPLRAIFEAMGAEIDWDEAGHTVTAVKGDTVVVLTIGEASAMVNGEAVLLDQPGLLLEGRTLAPLRFVAEAFGGSVYWDGAAQTAAITM